MPLSLTDTKNPILDLRGRWNARHKPTRDFCNTYTHSYCDYYWHV